MTQTEQIFSQTRRQLSKHGFNQDEIRAALADVNHEIVQTKAQLRVMHKAFAKLNTRRLALESLLSSET